MFNALHGRWGEDGCVQGLLELMRIPYTHSGVLASALAMHKERTKDVYRAAGLAGRATASWWTVARRAPQHLMEPPYVVKPVNEGSSVGVFIIRKGDNRPPGELGSDKWTLCDEMMVEEYVPGRELTVAVMGGKALARHRDHCRVRPSTTTKRNMPKAARCTCCRRRFRRAVTEEAMRLAERAHAALGCRGVTPHRFPL